ncbi:hypothetical protein DSL72_008931 [Monilinia vaccinii-corymbosi]|uniref:J domain-containing protein n=1 Tax=Monilinia vaccinii-corymbosi TaxID=61207 RepID=A0A8A3PSM7_9HELO|nr:hypothetical protein DSL72_008931 [Monilinia vaccinii-corymbosi]
MDHSIPNHYETLGISQNAVTQDIKNAFFALAKAHHPDKNNGGPTKEFVKVRAAYEILSDRDRRNVYDCHHDEVWGSMGAPTPKAQDNFTRQRTREGRYSYGGSGASSANEETGNSEAKEAEERKEMDEDNARRANESLDALMKELERMSGRFERREY